VRGKRLLASVGHLMPKKNPPHADSMPRTVTAGRPDKPPLPAGHEVVSPQRLPIHFGQAVNQCCHRFRCIVPG
jgi:hypothetical protein